MLDQLITPGRYVGGISGLDLLIARNNLAAQMNSFLISGRVSGLSPATLSGYQRTLSLFLRFIQGLGTDRAEDITPDYVRLFLLKCQETCKAVSIRDYFATIRRFFNWLIEEGTITASPLRTIKPPRIPRVIIQPFTADHIGKMLSWCDPATFLGLRNRAIIFVFLDTGLRLSELANIQLADIDFDRGLVKVMGKGARERRVRMGEKTQKAVLKYLLRRSDILPCLWVSDERIPLTPAGVTMMVRMLGKRAGLTGVRCSAHTFRHTAAINFLRNGAGEFSLQVLLGHNTLTMTRRYVGTLGQDDMIKAHEKFGPVDRMAL
jgi:integrase/recombinase XerC